MKRQANQDFLRLLSGAAGDLSIPALRALSPLEDNAQKLVDKAVVEVGVERLAVVQTMLRRGLTFNLPDPLSVMEVQWEQVSKSGGAQRTMLPDARGEDGQQDRRVKRVPIYCTTDDFSINTRTLKASERSGSPMDVSQIKQATRRVNEGVEDAAINGAGVQVDGYSTYGILNSPNANTHQVTSNWKALTGATIITDTLAAIGKLQADKKFGPYAMFVGTDVGNHFEDDLKANGDLTIRQRLEQMSFGGQPLEVVVADQFPNATTGNQAAIVQMTDDVCDVVVGQAPTVIPWTSPSGMVLYWLVLAVMVPRFRDDYDGNSGVILLAP